MTKPMLDMSLAAWIFHVVWISLTLLLSATTIYAAPKLEWEGKVSEKIEKWDLPITEASIQFSESKVGQGRLKLTPKSQGRWDLKGYQAIEVVVKNTSQGKVVPHVVVKSPNSIIPGFNKGSEQSITLAPGETKTLMVYLFVGDDWFAEEYPQYKSLRAGPGTELKWWTKVDPSHLGSLVFSNAVIASEREQAGKTYSILSILPIVLSEKYGYPEKVQFPMIDGYGQFNQGTWLGKVSSDAELKKSETQEQIALTKKARPKKWSQYGGYTGAPKQKATGYFRTIQLDGRWWFVDPDGYLFWSHGVNSVNTKGGMTTVEGRENYFETIPQSQHLTRLGLDNEKGPLQYNFTTSNLEKKYGVNWHNISKIRHHERLSSWGMNTVGNWSERETMTMNLTAYTVAVHYPYRGLGSKFPDMWAPETIKGLTECLMYLKDHHKYDSPWNIGFFINNELHWQDPAKFCSIVTRARKNQPAKAYFVKLLKEHYKDLKAVERATQISFATWDAILVSREAISYERIKAVADQYYADQADLYFSTCKTLLKKIFPNHLYLGSRFHDHIHPVPMKVADQYCDVISYNLYVKSIRDFKGPVANLSKPVLASEFHFGALDRGCFHCGLNYASSQQDRADHYADYVNGSLKNPLLVGAHWFQYGAQAFTGRSDGENFQCGVVDLTDSPYPELVEKIQDVGYHMYETRLGTGE
jgi:hypothetical protein